MGSFEYNGVKITVFGHASVMLESKEGKIIYIDPYILPEGDVEKADLVIFTHEHYDHCVDPSKIKKDDTILIGSNCKYAQKDIKPKDKISLDWVVIDAVYAYNINKKFHPKGAGVGVIVNIDGVRIYHASDTDFIPEMKELKGKVDIALLPIGGTYTMNVDEAVEAVKAIKPKIVVPIHYNIINGTEADPNEFAEKVKEEAPDVEVKVLY
ncbi:MBL fold metallo-hydrolase [Candidatus Micrarchaeota archaeon]|nr:MBL fold metallo-hydrolase [Candidatus Micrarchaeota archaeon]